MVKQINGNDQRTVQFSHPAPERKLSKHIKSLDLNIKSINFKISWYFFIKENKSKFMKLTKISIPKITKKLIFSEYVI